jgi:hypothetical protein
LPLYPTLTDLVVRSVNNVLKPVMRERLHPFCIASEKPLAPD